MITRTTLRTIMLGGCAAGVIALPLTTGTGTLQLQAHSAAAKENGGGGRGGDHGGGQGHGRNDRDGTGTDARAVARRTRGRQSAAADMGRALPTPGRATRAPLTTSDRPSAAWTPGRGTTVRRRPPCSTAARPKP